MKTIKYQIEWRERAGKFPKIIFEDREPKIVNQKELIKILQNKNCFIKSAKVIYEYNFEDSPFTIGL